MASATVGVLNLSTGEHKVTEPLPGHYAVHDLQFQRTMGALFSSPLADGNLAADFQKADEIFPAMLAHTRGAKKPIYRETYIYWSGAVGKSFPDALAERARAGIRENALDSLAGLLRSPLS